MEERPPLSPTPPGAVTSEPLAMPPIALHPQATPPAPPLPPKPKEPEQKDSYRELVETVVFVVVLVLMLKTFLAEAFVIPTGSMADTLMGYHHKVACQQCGYTNLVNASEEVEPQNGPPLDVLKCQCVNCGFINTLAPRGGRR